MTQNTVHRYRRLMAEGTAIVVSVLLAFAIQAWWEQRRERAEEVRLLIAVLDEMRSNLSALEGNRAFHLAVLSADNTALRLAGLDPRSLTVEYADSLIADLSWWNGSTSWATGAVSALTSSGRLSAIRDEPLRRIFAEWPKRVDMVRAAEDQEYDFFIGVFMPYIRKEGSLAQISDAIRTRPGSQERYTLEKLNYAPTDTDHRRILVSREFQNMVLHRRWIQDDILDWYDKFAATLHAAIRALEIELAERGVPVS
jgi:hypothetical protein